MTININKFDNIVNAVHLIIQRVLILTINSLLKHEITEKYEF